MNRDAQHIYSRPGHLIRRLQQIAVAFFMEETAEFDITPVQYSALLAIRNHPGIDQTTLVNIIAFDRSTIGDVVTRLEKKGMIRRVPSDVDRRANVLYIAAPGQRLLSKVKNAVEAAQAKIVAPLSPEERRAFMMMMQKLVQLNNGHSRAPLQLTRTQKNKAVPAPNASSPSSGRTVSSARR